MTNFTKGIVGITIGVLLIANVFMSVVKAQNTTGWSTSEVALWGVLGLAGIIGLVYGAFAMFGLA